jgi:ribosome maturation protein Sdo1
VKREEQTRARRTTKINNISRHIMDPHAQNERVETALSQLVDHLLPATEYEDESDAEARQDEVLERVHEIIGGFGFP